MLNATETKLDTGLSTSVEPLQPVEPLNQKHSVKATPVC